MAILDIGTNPGFQYNIAVNPARRLVFFGGASVVCYNYKTNQWSRVSAYDGLSLFSINDKTADIGVVRNLVVGPADLQKQLTSYVAQTATITTGAPNINQGGRAVVNGLRPIVNGGTYSVRVGVQDKPSDAVSYSSATSVNTRSGMANFRSEGRYIRAELTITGGFTTANGADVIYSAHGRV